MNRRFILATSAIVCGLTFMACNTEPQTGTEANPNTSSQTGATLRSQAVVNQVWSSLNPGTGGQIQAVALDPNKLDRAFLLSDVEGLYTSNNGGTDWTYSSTGLAGTDTLALAVKPTASGAAFNSGAERVFLGTSVGLHISTNGGASWTLDDQIARGGTLQQFTNTSPNLTGSGDDGKGFGSAEKMSISTVVVNPKSTAQVVVGLGSRRWSWVDKPTIYRSTNSGVDFSKIEISQTISGNSSVLQLAARETTGSTELYAATGGGGLWRSTDFGASTTWQKIRKPNDTAFALNRAEGVGVTNDGSTLYAIYGDGQKTNRDAANGPIVIARSAIYAIRVADLEYGATTSSKWKKIPFAGVVDDASEPYENDSYFKSITLSPSSNANNQSLLTAAAGNGERYGLYQLYITWGGTAQAPTLSAVWDRIFFFGQRFTNPVGGSQQAKFDIGWEGGIFGNRPQAKSFAFAPATWSKNEIWTTGDQTVFKTDRGAANFKDNWKALYTKPKPGGTDFPELKNYSFATESEWELVNVGWTPANTYGRQNPALLKIPSLGPIRTYTNNGTASTVDTDVAMYGNIIISSKGDHGLVTSYDGGTSWENVSQPRRAKSQSNQLVPLGGNRVLALAHFTDPFDFGATGGSGDANGELWGRMFDTTNPRPARWYYLAGGDAAKVSSGNAYGDAKSIANSPFTDQRLGLVNDFYTNIILAPTSTEPYRLIVTTKNQGIYKISNIDDLFCKRSGNQFVASDGSQPCLQPIYSRFEQVSTSNANEYEGSAVIDPNNPNILYVANLNKVQRIDLTKSLNDAGLVTDIYTGASNTLVNIGAWSNASTTWIAASSGANIVLSKNGAAWTTLVDKGQLLAERGNNAKFNKSSVTTNRLIIHAIEGNSNKVYATLQVQDPENIGYGVFEISFNTANGARTGINDISGNHPFPKSFRTEVITDQSNSSKYLMMSSWGAGLWRTPIQ